MIRVRPLAVAVAAAVVLVAVLILATPYLSPAASSSHVRADSTTLAPDFTLTDIYGHPFTLSSYRSSDVVVVEFTSLSCSECKVVEQTLSTMYAGYNQTGASPVKVISVFINPQFGDTIPLLQAFHTQYDVTWTMAQDTNSLTVSKAYGVIDIPTVVVVDKQGQPVYDVSGVQDANTLDTTIGSALQGKATAVSLVTVSVFAVAAVAGVTTFFSPCAFPMFPGYMSLFLGLDAKRAASANGTGDGRSTVRRALAAGSISAGGMMIVFVVIGGSLALAASVIGRYVPYLQVGVGIVLIALGGLLLTNLQYWRIVSPFQRLWGRITGKREGAAVVTSATATESGFNLKLFGYGMGYAAAAAGCVAPVVLAAIFAGFELGLLGGILSILVYSLTAALLMIVVTIVLALAGARYVNRLKALAPLIKKISAVALVIVGVYLVYFFYSAWVI